MSRSLKKHVWCCDRNPFMKNYANRRLRRMDPMKDVAASGKWYRKTTNPWDICDWKWYGGESFHDSVGLAERINQRRLSDAEREDLYRKWRRLCAK